MSKDQNQPMVIQANESGQKAIQGLCDMALKTGGLQNMAFVSQLLMSIKPIPPQDAVPVETGAKVVPIRPKPEAK